MISLRSVSVSVLVSVLPQVSSLPHYFTHVNLDWLLLTIHIHLHSRTVDLVQVLKDLLNSFI